MSNNKVALLTDTHWGSRNDSPVFLEYFMKFYDDVFFPYLKENNITTLIHLGDICDRRKYINFRTLQSFRENFVFRLWEHKIDTHVIVGNHDTFNRHDSSINSMKELFSTFEGECEPWVYSEPTEVVIQGHPILFLPWMNGGNQDATKQMIADSKSPVAMGHLEVAGFQMHRGAPNSFGESPGQFEKFDKVMSGHYHHKSDNGTVFYLGAPYEMTWSDYQDPRGFHIFDLETRELEHIINPYRMYHKIFYNDKDKSLENMLSNDFERYRNRCVKFVVQEKNNPYWYDMVLDKLYKVDPFNVAIVEDYSEDLLSTNADDTIDQAQDTMSILTSYVDTMEVNQKQEIKDLISSLYSEALTSESD